MQAIPRPAATILLLRDGAAGLEVFMVVRHHEIAFAAGALVFPGGRVEAADADLASRLTNDFGLEQEALAFRIAAIRETFEECGVLLARPRESRALLSGTALQRMEAAHRADLNAGAIGFEAMLLQEDLVPAIDLLVPFAHWITPVAQPKRYDTQFFLAAAPAEHLAVHDGREAVDSVWIAPSQALEGTRTGRYRLIFATAKNLEKLSRSRSTAEALAVARNGRVVTVLPESTKLDGTRRLMRIPAEADYGGSEFIIDSPPASGA
jgi:8-oxo-dGTP pyrophosphatase MutT (NUDIX family)